MKAILFLCFLFTVFHTNPINARKRDKSKLQVAGKNGSSTPTPVKHHSKAQLVIQPDGNVLELFNTTSRKGRQGRSGTIINCYNCNIFVGGGSGGGGSGGHGGDVGGGGIEPPPPTDVPPSLSNAPPAVTGYTFQQCMDHDSPMGCDQTWNQRYWVNAEYSNYSNWQGPVFFWLGGEWNAETDCTRGEILWYASNYGGYIICLEHRFYGESFPHRNFTAQGLRIHTSRQALRDAERFIRDFKQRSSWTTNVPWVVLGCSYSANLAAYFKSMYPTLVKTVVSSSGPVMAQYDFPEYIGNLFMVMQREDPDCYNIANSAISCYAQIMRGQGPCQGFSSYSDIYRAMPVCTVNPNPIYYENFYKWVIQGFWSGNAPLDQLKMYCGPLKQTDASKYPAQRYADFVNANLKKPSCSPGTRSLELEFYYRERKKEAKRRNVRTTITENDMWLWQTCNEFGYYQSGGGPARGLWSADYETRNCNSKWGWTTDQIKANVDSTNTFYGGLNLHGVRCVQFVHGEYDPWHWLGVYLPAQTNSENTVYLISRAEHCTDTLHNRTAPVYTAQQSIQARIGTYNSNFNC